ncbi:hypothetical protein CC1G_15774 [Coprinopsis cinerea okayama7|uniref:Uncharacterized protein n=1 Tax=Coprinopsis cinerea (strain Okayama-7 / 130 / ATCC MYA-4618 / FGSC 9003) TaxID=240176 RepID=D6RR17_COPC7|nr:hypothetical protein CC1G_15774 [Coprinopsis cinerea okayama7\|eukprot:XP_002910054.1 hypothetical protein CC1G_15774 [Coprinopsis cinerea okayama7\
MSANNTAANTDSDVTTMDGERLERPTKRQRVEISESSTTTTTTTGGDATVSSSATTTEQLTRYQCRWNRASGEICNHSEVGPGSIYTHVKEIHGVRGDRSVDINCLWLVQDGPNASGNVTIRSCGKRIKIGSLMRHLSLHAQDDANCPRHPSASGSKSTLTAGSVSGSVSGSSSGAGDSRRSTPTMKGFSFYHGPNTRPSRVRTQSTQSRSSTPHSGTLDPGSIAAPDPIVLSGIPPWMRSQSMVRSSASSTCSTPSFATPPPPSLAPTPVLCPDDLQVGPSTGRLESRGTAPRPFGHRNPSQPTLYGPPPVPYHGHSQPAPPLLPPRSVQSAVNLVPYGSSLADYHSANHSSSVHSRPLLALDTRSLPSAPLPPQALSYAHLGNDVPLENACLSNHGLAPQGMGYYLHTPHPQFQDETYLNPPPVSAASNAMQGSSDAVRLGKRRWGEMTPGLHASALSDVPPTIRAPTGSHNHTFSTRNADDAPTLLVARFDEMPTLDHSDDTHTPSEQIDSSTAVFSRQIDETATATTATTTTTTTTVTGATAEQTASASTVPLPFIEAMQAGGLSSFGTEDLGSLWALVQGAFPAFDDPGDEELGASDRNQGEEASLSASASASVGRTNGNANARFSTAEALSSSSGADESAGVERSSISRDTSVTTLDSASMEEEVRRDRDGVEVDKEDQEDWLEYVDPPAGNGVVSQVQGCEDESDHDSEEDAEGEEVDDDDDADHDVWTLDDLLGANGVAGLTSKKVHEH